MYGVIAGINCHDAASPIGLLCSSEYKGQGVLLSTQHTRATKSSTRLQLAGQCHLVVASAAYTKMKNKLVLNKEKYLASNDSS